MKQVILIEKKYDINWGSYNHLKAFLYLAKEAIKDTSVDYLHAVTGQDYPVKSSVQINAFFKKKERSLLTMEFFRLKAGPEAVLIG